MVQLREAIGFAAFVVGAAALTAVNHHPTHGRHTERERIAVEAAAGQLTHQQIADAWAQTKLGNGRSLQELEQGFPLPVRSVHQEGAGIVLTFHGHEETCIDFVSQPDSQIVRARRC